MTYILIAALIIGVGIYLISKKNVKNIQNVKNDGKKLSSLEIKVVKPIVKIGCNKKVGVVYYSTPDELSSYFKDIRQYEVFWDNRYSEAISTTTCLNNVAQHRLVLMARNKVNVAFGGPQSTLIHKTKARPWSRGTGLMMQYTLNYAEMQVLKGDPSGNVALILFAENVLTGKRINILVSTIVLGHAWVDEQPEPLYDPTTKTTFYSSSLKKGNKYTSMDNYSNEVIQRSGPFKIGGGIFFRSIITYENFQTMISRADLGHTPEDWELTIIGLQTEIEESTGEANLELNFENFEAYIVEEIKQ